MARWAGMIGFVNQVETSPGVWEEIATEKAYTGDLIKSRRFFKDNNGMNDQMNISNQISFIADPYALQNFNFMRYATYMGFKWKIKDIDIESHRLNLTLGDIYNGEQNGFE